MLTGGGEGYLDKLELELELEIYDFSINWGY